MRRLKDGFRDNLLLVRVTPPLSEKDTGLRATDSVVLAPRHVGTNLHAITSFPVRAEVIVLGHDIPTDCNTADLADERSIGLADLYKTYDEAKAHMPLSTEQGIERSIEIVIKPGSTVDASFLYCSLVGGPLLVPFWSIESGRLKLDYYRYPEGEVLGCVFSSEEALLKHYVKSMSYVKLRWGADAFALIRDSAADVKKVIVNPGIAASVVLSEKEVDAVIRGENPAKGDQTVRR